MSALERVRAKLGELEQHSLRRTLRRSLPGGALDFASNDYLGLSYDPRVLAALPEATRAGSGGSRLLSGAHDAHVDLEGSLAAWTRRESALLFSSGYLAVLGAIVTLAPFVRHAYSDKENHACAIDALRLTKLDRTLFARGTLPAGALRIAPAMVVTESLFGMSGTRVDVAALVASLGTEDVLVVDEAHALGVAGPRGAGLCADIADPRLVVVGTLSKALGGAGGFVAGPSDVIALLATSARTFVFDTAPPPVLARAMRVAVEIVASDEGERRRTTLRENVATLHAALAANDIDVGCAASLDPIVPLLVGSVPETIALSTALEERGIFAPAIRPPTVSPGRAQLRITVRADHARADLERFAREYAAVRLART